MNNHPHLKTLHSLYLSETQAFRKVHRMIDLFESIIKMHTVVILSEYVTNNKLSDSAKGLLAQGLRAPSLGTWQLFSRVLFEELQKDNYECLLSDFATEFISLDKALNAEKTNVINLRNNYAHGATPTDATCEIDIKQFDPFLTKLMELKWLALSSMEVKDGKVFITTSNGTLSLHPMLLYRKEDSETSFAFFNDIKNDKIGLLNYPLSKHYKEKDFFAEFHEQLPLNEWKKTGNSEFYQRIEELTETFKGRTAERKKLLQFVSTKNKGYFSIQGNPGIGKSALIAQFFKDLRAKDELKNIQVVEYFIRRATQQAGPDYLLNYLIKRTDEIFPQGKEIRAEGKMVFDLQNQLFAKWRLYSEQAKGQKILFLIDGLDEGVENDLVSYLPRQNFDNIIIIYGSRTGGHKSIDDLWASLPAEYHTKLELSGLSKADIRALIYEVANKYKIDRESAWIDAVQKRSQGNPLYLKLLCDAIENGSISLNDINALPKKIEEYYKAILQRYAQDMVDGDALLSGLFTFAAAKDYLTLSHLGLINTLGDATVQRIGSTLKEVLYENPLTEEVLDYQLFHESFREYLIKEKSKEVSDATNRIVNFCATWQELEGNWEQRYALEHYATHLCESKKEARTQELLDLLKNTGYDSAQKKVLKHFNATRIRLQLTLLKASEVSNVDAQLESALQLVDLKYDEANDAPQVVALVAGGDIELALQRINSFGGTDKEGVKRRFILYMLCLMELTLLQSKSVPHRRKAIEMLLKHLDEQLPKDHSILDWDDFFSNYLMAQMACEWADEGLDYLVVYKRTKSSSETLRFLSTEMAKKGKLKEASTSLQESLSCAREISDDYCKSRALSCISIELTKQGMLEEAADTLQESLSSTQEISDDYDKIRTLIFISIELVKQEKLEEALSCAREISGEWEWAKSSALSSISTKLAKQGKLKEATDTLQESLSFAREISDDYHKSRALNCISIELAKQGMLEEALSCAREIIHDGEKSRLLGSISSIMAEMVKGTTVKLAVLSLLRNRIDDSFKSSALSSISIEQAKQGKFKEALSCARVISDDYHKSRALSCISIELAKQGMLVESLSCAREISDDRDKSTALSSISTEFYKQGILEEATAAVQESLSCAREISNDEAKSSALSSISIELAKQDKIEESLSCSREISDDEDKSKTFVYISTEMVKKGKLEEAAATIQTSLSCAQEINDDEDKSIALSSISTELAKKGKLEEAIYYAREIISYRANSSALISISTELAKKVMLEESLSCAREISDDGYKFDAFVSISTEMAKQERLEEALSCAREISDDYSKSRAFSSISTVMAKQGKLEEATAALQEALSCARAISHDWIKSSTLLDISTEMAKQAKLEEALSCAREIISYTDKSSAMYNISIEIAKQWKFTEALSCAREISNDEAKSRALSSISTEMAKQGKLEEAAATLQEALSCARAISDDDWNKSEALCNISTEMAKQGKLEEALSCVKEISNDSDKSSALRFISTEMAKQGKLEESENTAYDIPQLAERYSTWMNIAKMFLERESVDTALERAVNFRSEEAKLFYLKGWCANVTPIQTDESLIRKALTKIVEDSESIETLLYKYALHTLTLGSPSRELQNSLNQTLNIQWVLDIVAKFPKTKNVSRTSTNLDTWLHEIADEDDRDQITLWAKQVAKGKITEEEFNAKINDL